MQRNDLTTQRNENRDTAPRGARLRRLRLSYDVHLADFARRCGFTGSQWANYEAGRGMSHDVVFRLIDLFPGLTSQWIFCGNVRGVDYGTAERLGEGQAFLTGLADDLAALAEKADGDADAKRLLKETIDYLVRLGARPRGSKQRETPHARLPNSADRRLNRARMRAIVSKATLALTSIVIWEIAEQMIGIVHAASPLG